MVTAHPPLSSEAGIVRAPSVASAQEPAGTMALEPSPFPRSGLSAAPASAEGETEAWRSALGARAAWGGWEAGLWQSDPRGAPSRGHPVWLQPHRLPLPLLPAPADALAPPNLCLRALSSVLGTSLPANCHLPPLLPPSGRARPLGRPRTGQLPFGGVPPPPVRWSWGAAIPALPPS